MYHKIRKKFYEKILKKDTMELDIQYYRNNGAKIGNNVRTFSPIISSEPYLIEISDNVTISSGVLFTTHDNSVSKLLDDVTDVFGRIRILDGCFIGQNTIILPGVTLGEHTIVGAGSVVTKSFHDGKVVIAGNPAKIICSIEEYKLKVKDLSLNTLKMNKNEKMNFILNNSEKLVIK